MQEKLSTDQKKTALKDPPTLLEVAGHTYFFGGFMVGPQVYVFSNIFLAICFPLGKIYFKCTIFSHISVT